MFIHNCYLRSSFVADSESVYDRGFWITGIKIGGCKNDIKKFDQINKRIDKRGTR